MEDFNDSCSSLKFIDDVFLKSADPDEAVLKLEECGHAISDIALGNFQFERIFQLDFFLGLKCMSMKSMFCCNSSKELICNRALLAWQLLAAADSKSAAVKQLGFLSSDIRNAIEDARICLHPYTRGHGKYVREYDEVLSSLCADGDAALFPRALGEQDFIKYLSKIGYSLFRKRVLQYDVFSRCSCIEKWTMLHKAAGKLYKYYQYMPAELLSVLHFFMQVLTSGEDDEVKLECCKILSRRHKFADFAPPKIDFSRFKTFEDFAISLDVYGIPLDLCSAICLLCKRPKWMISLSERCPDTVDQSFPMSSFVCRNASRILDIFLDNARKRAA